MFNLIIKTDNSDIKSYIFSSIEKCIDLINSEKTTAFVKSKKYIYFIFTDVELNDTSVQSTFVLNYDISNNIVYTNNDINASVNLYITKALKSKILYDLCKTKISISHKESDNYYKDYYI